MHYTDKEGDFALLSERAVQAAVPQGLSADIGGDDSTPCQSFEEVTYHGGGFLV